MADLIRGSYRQRSRYLNGLRESYKDIVNSEGENTQSANNLHKEIIELDKELKAIDGSIGTTFRNGKYS